MSNFSDEIKKSIEDFKQPAKQSLKNLKDDIRDDIKDNVENPEGEPKKNGCLSKVFSIIVICLIIGMISNQCGGDNGNSETASDITPQISDSQTAYDNNVVTSEETSEIYLEHLRSQIEYANQNNITTNRFPNEEKALADFLETVDRTEIYLTSNGKNNSEEFKRTQEIGDYVYFGELKDNKPHGYGVLFKKSEIPYGAIIFGDEIYYNCYYMGKFKNGRFDGFGLLFDIEESSINDLISHCTYPQESDMFYNYYLEWENSVSYFGMFSNGERNGLGNYFSVFNLENLDENYNLDNLSYSIIEIGEFKGEYLNGDGKIYWGGYLYYDGELKDGMKHGNGKLYYLLSESLEYQGEFKNDKRHGYGISYSDNGEVVYEGDWKNDDYK